MKFTKPSLLRGLMFACAIIALLAASALPARAQVTPLAYARIYPLTNSTTFTIASGGTNLATAAITTINSQPFPLVPGRGFTAWISGVGTNAGTAAITPYFQFASPNYSNGVLVTNWQSVALQGTAMPMNGTTKVFAQAPVLPTAVDNVTIGRLAYVSNAHTASFLLDSTNTYVSITK